MEVPGKRTDDEVESVASLDKLCEPCEIGNVNTPASGFCKECEEYMCNACFTQHLRWKSCRRHTLLDINACSETCLKIHSRATKCKQHDGEVIQFYCRKHEAVGCGHCMVLGHNACKSETIKDLSDNFQQNEEYKTFMRHIEKLISERKESEKKIQENKLHNKLMLEKALQYIKQFRLDINKYLDKVETDIRRQVKKVMEENETLLTKLENDCTMLSTKLEEITNMLNSELYKDNVLFIHTVECKSKLTENEKVISNLKSNSMKKYGFECDQQLRRLVTSAHPIGTLAISPSPVFPQTTEGVNKKGVRSVIAVGARVQHNSWVDWRGGRVVERVLDLRVGPVYQLAKGTILAVHADGMVSVKWDNGWSGRFRVGEGDDEVTLTRS